MLKAEINFIFDEKKDIYIIKLTKKSFFFGRNRENKPDFIRNEEIETQPPRNGCRAFVTDLVVGDEFINGHISEIYKLDGYSDYVGVGKYKSCFEAFPNAAKGTFDGIAIDSGTRIIIYSKPDFKGKLLLDKTGPAIINNIRWKKDARYKIYMKKKFKSPYNDIYPPKVRIWSRNNMHNWTKGSAIVICNNNSFV